MIKLKMRKNGEKRPGETNESPTPVAKRPKTDEGGLGQSSHDSTVSPALSTNSKGSGVMLDNYQTCKSFPAIKAFASRMNVRPKKKPKSIAEYIEAINRAKEEGAFDESSPRNAFWSKDLYSTGIFFKETVMS